MSAILGIADTLESQIREFLADGVDGGKFDLPYFENGELAIPLMILLFTEEGWCVEFDNDENSDWLTFSKPVYEDDYTFVEEG